MSPAFESYLARLYTDAAERAHFLADPRARAEVADLAPAEIDALATIDRDGLALAAESFARKRTDRERHARRGFAARLQRLAGARP
jgi:hypothetical protein